MRGLLICLLLLKAGFTYAHVERLVFLTGTLGEKRIGMRLVMEDTFWHGEYFFPDTKTNIIFKGNCNAQACTFSVYQLNLVTHKEEAIETLALTENEDKSWTGTWTGSGKSLPVNLKPIEISEIKHLYKDLPLVKQLDPYSYLRTADIEFKEVKTKKINGITVQILKEKLTGTEFIRLKKGLSDSQLVKVNDLLAGIHITQVEGQFWCGTSLVKGEYHFNYSISFINKKILCLNTSISSNCQGTGREIIPKNLTIDLRTGAELSLEDVFYFGKGDIPLVNSNEWYPYRYNVFGKRIFEILKDLYPEKLSHSSGNCSINKAEAWQFPEWRIIAKGLALKPDLPDYLQCPAAEEIVIPFDKLEAFRKREIQ